MTDEQTCGKGLAEHAPLPEKLSRVTGGMADVLDFHKASLDLTDDAARQEHDAYASLVRQFRDVSQRLAAIAAEMAGYRDLPMGRHDEQALADPRFVDTFAAYIARERELLELLQGSVARDEEMLAMMRG